MTNKSCTRSATECGHIGCNLFIIFSAESNGFQTDMDLLEPPVINTQCQNTQADSPSTQEGLLRVVPATFPGKQEHLTVWERSSMRFLLQHRWAAITSHVPPSADRHRHRRSVHDTERFTDNRHELKLLRRKVSSSVCTCFLFLF